MTIFASNLLSMAFADHINSLRDLGILWLALDLVLGCIIVYFLYAFAVISYNICCTVSSAASSRNP
jgi:hypothetical protein